VNVIGRLHLAAVRHAHVADAAIALTMFAATMLTTFAGHGAAAVGTAGSRPVTIGAAAAACGALAGRRRHPLAVLAVSTAAAELLLIHDEGTRGVLILLAPSIALYTVAEQPERRRGLLLGTGALALFVIAHALAHPARALLGPENLAFAALGALAIAAGDSSRNRRAYLAEVERRAEHAEAEREHDARRRVAAERLRIARDLHDAVGHQLALISVQSNVAAQSVDHDAGAARQALGHVKSASRQALAELRDTIGLLRQPGDPVAPTAVPAPGLDALEELLAALRASGLTLDHGSSGSAVPLAPAADLTAYRVVQEALTNVAKHSCSRQARLTLAYGTDGLRIEVVDLSGGGTAGGFGPADAPVSADRHGIRGMRERVLALGGAFTAGPRPDGTFHVIASLPYQPLADVPEGVA
jgi:signal transduction histidine kinase